MDVVRIVLILAGVILLLLAGVKKDFAQFSPGWLGLALLAVVFLLQITVK